MFSILKRLSQKKKSMVLIAFILLIAITFETAQQLYYVNRFNLAEGATFFELVKTQSKSWVIWMLLAFPLIRYVEINSHEKTLGVNLIIRSALVIIGLTFTSIIIISIWRMLEAEGSFSLSILFSEYIPFYIFQKMPMFTLGYIAITIILYLYFANEQLLIQVEALGKLKKRHSELYQKLSPEIDDKATVLNIKIGNKRKIIPVEHIYWIEADDYCAKVHTKNESYAMRITLKALQQKLDSNFLRVHRNAIVNMNKVVELDLAKTPELILENNAAVTISKSNLKMVRNFIS